MDLHRRESQRFITADDGTITDRRLATSRNRLTAVCGERPRDETLREARTESEWVAPHLESLGHEVLVPGPNDAPICANRSRRTTTDARDARTLRDDGAAGAWCPAYRLSDARCLRAHADAVHRDGEGAGATRWKRVPTSASAWVPTRIAALDFSPRLTAEFAQLLAVFAPLNALIVSADARIAAVAKEDPVATRISRVNGSGRRACHGERVRGHHRRDHATSHGTRGEGVPGRDSW